MLTVDEARARIGAQIRTTGRLDTERVPIWEARGRFLTAAWLAGRALPAWANSAMDGFAARAADLPGTLVVTGAVAAGHPRAEPVAAGTAVRIMTGAPLPPGADTVVMFEESHATADGRHVTLPAAPVGAHVRHAGEDVAVGDAVVPAGARLDAAALALIAALGGDHVEVGRRPRVAILSTGDELVDVSVTPRPGQIVDSSAHALRALCADAGAAPSYLGVIPDRRDELAAALRQARDYDVVLTTGGVSAGDFDHVRGALADAGVVEDLWKVAMKPGKPLSFSMAGATPVFGLPGNPVSTMISFELFVRPTLLALQGAADTERPRAPVVLPAGYQKPTGRAHYLRARLQRDGERLIAHVAARQGSHMMSSMVGCDALIELAADVTEVAPGGTAPALLLEAR